METPKNKIVQIITELLEDYLDNKIQGNELVKKYGEIITGDNFPWESPDIDISSLDEFHDELSYYVSDYKLRQEFIGFYGNRELREKVNKLLQKLK